MDKKNTFSGLIEVLCIAAIVCIAMYLLYAKAEDLKQKEQEAIVQEELLKDEIEAQKERTEELEEEKKYMKTDKYIEEIARDKLGLINPDEVLFQENEGN